MEPEGEGMCRDWTPEQFADAFYRAGHTHAAALLREGLHPDAIRARVYGAEEISGKPWGDDTWRGIEDALAGRPARP